MTRDRLPVAGSRSPVSILLAGNLFEDGFQRGPELARFMQQFPGEIRGILREAGVKVAR